MRPVITAEEIRAAEQRCFDANPGVDLMARAAQAVAEVAGEFQGDVLVVVGPGNNGGDGLFAAALLAPTRTVRLWPVLGRAHEAGLAAARQAGCEEVDAQGAMLALGVTGLVIDAFVGIGSRPGLPPEVALLAGACRAHQVPVLAVDHPSGLATDSCVAHQSFEATTTLTFQALKPCHVLTPAAERCGEVRVADIGVSIGEAGLREVEEPDLAEWYPWPGPTSHKYSRGVVLLDTGSQRYPGAALLSCAGALYTGVGMVRYTGAAPSSLVLGRYPSVVVDKGRAQAAVIGSGWGEADEVRAASVAALGVPVVADADALRSLPGRHLDGWLLTPHAGELARLLEADREAVEADPVGHVRRAAVRTGATVLLKGATQYIAEPSGRVTIALRGPAWTAQAGSGDVLAGMCGALMAGGLVAWQAATLAASLQALAAAVRPGPYPPDEVARRIPEVLAQVAGLE